MSTYNFENLQINGSVTTGNLILTGIPVTNTDTGVLIYSAANGGRVDQRNDVVFLDNVQTLSNKTLVTPVIYEGTINFGLTTFPLKYNYLFSVRTTSIAQITGMVFTIPNTSDNQTILCTLKSSFYDNTADQTAFVRNSRVFKYVTPSAITLEATTENLRSMPPSTNYSAIFSSASNTTISILLTPNTSNLTDIIVDAEFIVKS